MNFLDHETVLLYSKHAGLGDTVMSRLLFEEAKRAFPNHRLAFATKSHLIPAVSDHPSLDEVLDIDWITPESYPHRYDISVIYGAFQSELYYSCQCPLLHPADHMALRCGLELKSPLIHLRLTQKELDRGKELLDAFDPPGFKTLVIFCPKSSTKARDLSDYQVEFLVRELLRRNFYPVFLHNSQIYPPAPNFPPLTVRELMSVHAQAPYVVSCESSHYHLAAGSGTPTLGIFSFGDEKIYSKYYPKTVTIGQGFNSFPNASSISVHEIIRAFEQLGRTYPCVRDQNDWQQISSSRLASSRVA